MFDKNGGTALTIQPAIPLNIWPAWKKLEKQNDNFNFEDAH